MSNSIKVKYGLNSLNKEVDEGTTYSQVVNNNSIRGALGYGESVNILVDGESVDPAEEVEDDDVITIEKRAAAKA